MNHSKTSLAIASIVVAVGLTGVAFSLPQQALAHYGHHHNNHSNSIKVDQQVNQQNSCTGAQVDNTNTNGAAGTVSFTDCQNFGDNQADISK
jgi:hypothetical protein